MAYVELFFAILPGALIDFCSRSQSKYLNRGIGIAICLAISIGFSFIQNVMWGISGNFNLGVSAILFYYAFRSFMFGSFQSSIAELFPVSLMTILEQDLIENSGLRI
jgi:hypothetical protein